ncbi:MAG: Fe-S cluster assembly scaffold protein NifU [Chloroflexi bacterium]|nr:Fe-S cluster assembly scaffold protein NifU [Chloroflexota bacterium]
MDRGRRDRQSRRGSAPGGGQAESHVTAFQGTGEEVRTVSTIGALYSDKVMDHVRNPRNVGEMENPDGIGHVGNPVCGDIMELYIKVDKGVIIDARFKTFGCGAAIATSSMVTELVKGKTIDEALRISNKAVAEALDGLPPIKMHCSVLAEEALKSAIDDYLARRKSG